MAGQTSINIARRLLDFAVGGLFLYAGAVKLCDPARFAVDVFNFQILPWRACALLALYLPCLEIVCGAALAMKRLYLGAVGLLTALTVLFLGALGSAWFRGLDIDCGCFGDDHPHSVIRAAGQDVVLLAALVFLLVGAFSSRKARGSN